ncbi:MAG: hypothetical protein WD993_04500 [Thermoleophilaceae bacterium]
MRAIDVVRRPQGSAYAGATAVAAFLVALVLAQPSDAAKPTTHTYKAVVKVDVVEEYTFWDGAYRSTNHECADLVGSGMRTVRWTARIPRVRYVRARGAKGSPRVEVLSAKKPGRARFGVHDARVDAQLRDGSPRYWPPSCQEVPFATAGALEDIGCSKSLRGKRLAVELFWTPTTKVFGVYNAGSGIPGAVDQCGPSYLNNGDLQPSTARTQFGAAQALFDGFQATASAAHVRRLRAGRPLHVRGAVRLDDALQDCCIGIGFARNGAIWNVLAKAEIRLEPRRGGQRRRRACARPRLIARPSSIERGDIVAFTGRCFKPKRAVALFMGRAGRPGSKVASARTNGTGTFQKRHRGLARAGPGRYVVRACQQRCRVEAKTTLRIEE